MRKGEIFEAINLGYNTAGGTLAISIISQIGVRFLPCLFVCYLLKVNMKSVFKFNKITLKQFLMCLGIYISSILTVSFVHNITSYFAEFLGKSYEMNNYFIANDFSSVVILIIAIGVIPPLFEEIFFRGFMFSGSEKYGAVFAIIFTSFTFAITHDNPYRLFELFCYAVFAGIMVHYTKSLWPGLIIHILTNTSYVIGSYVKRGDLVEGIETASSVGTVAISGVFGIIGLVLSIYLIFRLRKICDKEVKKKIRINEEKISILTFKEMVVPITIVIISFCVKCFML